METILKAIKRIREDKGISREEMAKHVGILVHSYGKIERGEVTLTLERLYKIADFFKMDISDILNYYNSSGGNITYIPVKAQAGALAEMANEANRYQYKSFSIPFFNESDLIMIDIEGDSMYPTFSNGDYVIIKQVDCSKPLKYRQPFVIDTTDGRVTKRIYRNEDEKYLTLKSDNAFYEPYDIEKEIILSIWEVRGFMSKSLIPKGVH